MTPAPQSQDPENNDSQPSIEIDWPSDTDLSTLPDLNTYFLDWNLEAGQQNNDELSAILDLETYASVSNPETVQQSIEESYSEIQSTAEETQAIPGEVNSSTRSTSPRIVDDNACTSDPISSASPPLVHPSPRTDTRSEGESKAEVELEQNVQDQLRLLRYKLQKGLLPEVGQPKADEMKAMSLYLKRLERMATPSRSTMIATSIYKLLKKIRNVDEISRDGKFSFKERAAKLCEKWEASLGKEDPTTSSTAQPIGNHSIELNAIPDNQEPADYPDAQQLLDNKAKASATGLTEECQLEMAVESEPTCKSTSDYSIEPGLVLANENSPPSSFLVLEAQSSSKSTLEHIVIDLTDDNEVDIDTGSELPGQPTNYYSSGSGVVKAAQTIRSSSPTDSDQFVSCNVLKDQASPSSSMSRSNTKKRTWSDASKDQSSQVSGSDTGGSDTSHTGNIQSSTAAAKPINENTPTRRRTMRKTSPRQHLNNEIMWMSGSVRKIEKFIKEAEGEIGTIKKKKARLLEENAAEMESAMSRRDELVDLKAYLLAWGAQDEKVIKEWALSR